MPARSKSPERRRGGVASFDLNQPAPQSSVLSASKALHSTLLRLGSTCTTVLTVFAERAFAILFMLFVGFELASRALYSAFLAYLLISDITCFASHGKMLEYHKNVDDYQKDVPFGEVQLKDSAPALKAFIWNRTELESFARLDGGSEAAFLQWVKGQLSSNSSAVSCSMSCFREEVQLKDCVICSIFREGGVERGLVRPTIRRLNADGSMEWGLGLSLATRAKESEGWQRLSSEAKWLAEEMQATFPRYCQYLAALLFVTTRCRKHWRRNRRAMNISVAVQAWAFLAYVTPGLLAQARVLIVGILKAVIVSEYFSRLVRKELQRFENVTLLETQSEIRGRQISELYASYYKYFHYGQITEAAAPPGGVCGR